MTDDVRGPTRRGLLAAALGTSALALAGCGGSDASASTPSGSTPAASGGGQATGASPTGASPAGTTAAGPAELAARATVPVLCYHQIRDWQPGDSAYTKRNLVCPPANFAAQLDAIKGAGYTTISPYLYEQHLRQGAQLPAKPVIVSLDDGKDNQISNALPALTQRGMTATFFLMTVVLGNPGWVRRDDVKRLADAGMTIGSHTWDHHLVPGYTGRDWAVQFDEPAVLLRKLSGQPVTTFAYPYGAWKEAALPHLTSAGYTTAYQLEDKPMDAGHPELTLRRALVDSSWTGPDVVARLERIARA